MRILHTGDIHLGCLNGPIIDGENARMQDTISCMDFLLEYAQEEKPDAILISGDLFDKAKLWGDQILKELDIAGKWLRKLADIAPTVLLFGTDNHESLRAFENIRSMCIYGLSIITAPDMFLVNTKSGLLQVAGIPGFDKGYFRSKFPGMLPAEESVKCSQLLGDIVNGLSVQLNPTIPSVLMAHYTVVGCELDNGQHIFSQSEVVLPKESLAGSSFDLVCLGHIHRAQRVECAGKPVFYSGAINGISFNEEGQDKGFWMHEIVADLPYDNVDSEFIKTPSREFLTLEIDLTESADLASDLKWKLAGIGAENSLLMFPTVGKIVRLEYECTEEQRPQLNHKEMEALLKSGGAFHVAEIKAKRVITSLTKQELSENSGPLENLLTWATAEGFNDAEISALIELAKPLVTTISAKMPTGTLSGVFVPRSLTVKNYRSYREEFFSFDDIYFAIVNGKNGIGKSAFFMDATSDCLFEETRSGETGSWITHGQTDGTITFEFGMGETVWRVVRARSIKGSGKITLALQEFLNDKWEDRSGTTARQTQEKIVTLLGMDCTTFRCTALIMQDAYGLFMEADKEARMEVLANILGLNIYEQLTELAKAKITELNRVITVSKAKLAELDEKLKGKPELVIALENNEHDLKETAEDIENAEKELKIAEDLVRTLQAKSEKSVELGNQIMALSAEITDKQAEIDEKNKQMTRAQQILDSEVQILSKASEYERVKEQITVLRTKEPKLLELKNDQKKTLDETTELDGQIKKLNGQIAQLEADLAKKPELDLAAAQYKEKLADLKKIETLSESNYQITQQIKDIEFETDKSGDQIFQKQISLREKQTQLDELRQKTMMLADSNCIDPENAKCAFLADAQKAKAQIPVAEGEIESIKNDIATIKESRKPLFDKIQILEKQRKDLSYDRESHFDLERLVESLMPKAELAGQLSFKSDLLKTLKQNLTDTEKRNQGLISHLKGINTANEMLRKELELLPSLIERLPKLEAWVKAKNELSSARQLKSTMADIIKNLEADIKDKREKIELLQSQWQICIDKSKKLPEAQQEVTRQSNNLKFLRENQSKLHAQIGGLKAQLEALTKDEAEQKKISDEMTPTARELVRYQSLTKAFGFDGIPFSIVRSVVPELSMMANDILGQMTGGQMALEMKTERIQKSNKKEVNTLEVWITDWRGNIPYGDRSGGQKVKAALATTFGLNDLKARRAGIQLGMLFTDEPPWLDSEGVEAYCAALESMNARHPNMKVIAISHDPTMIARFPQIIRVTDDGEVGSKVQLVS